MRKIQMFVKRNSSTILTCIGAIGVVATAIATARATPIALKALETKKEEKGEELTTGEKVQAVAPAYIPAVLTGATTIVCIFGANALNKRQQASLISAYAFLDKSYKDYRHKVVELMGKESDKLIRNEVVRDIYDNFELTEGKELFYDMYSQQYFESTLEEVEDAIDALNDRFEYTKHVSVNEFYSLLNIPQVKHGDDYGWAMYASRVIPGYDHIKFDLDTCELEDGMEVIIVTMICEPTVNFRYR